eukprot:TRINITY_DN177_c0_g1_i1.p1 TRINITY_DN177_c0_g1~~TRINITY_DN177_c0_g1_i1.p1  ORF type:complete len:606 (-),score=164.78 TRINITY_DN177_c0_g1_i1:337-2154(-)
MEWSRSRRVLAQMQQILNCQICKNTVVQPMSYGQCNHLFCRACVSDHPGGTCPAPGCQARADIKNLQSDRTMDSVTRSLVKISMIYGEEIPDRLKELTSAAESDGEEDMEIVLTPIEQNKSVDSLRPDERIEIIADDCSDQLELCDKENIMDEKMKLSKENIKPKPSRSKKNSGGAKKEPVKKDIKKNAKSIPDVDTGIHIEENNTVNKVAPANKSKELKAKPTVSNRKKMGSATPADKRNKKGETMLHQAACKGDLAKVGRFLKEGHTPNTVDYAGWSPLHEAAMAGNTELVTLLLNYGASPNIHDKNENLTPLHDAAESGYVEIVRLLVSHGAEPKARNSKGETPLDLAKNDSVKDALLNTVCLMTESEAMDQSIVVENLMLPENVVLSAPESSDAEWKKISQAASRLAINKPVRSLTENTTHCLLNTGKQVNILGCQIIGAIPTQEEWIFQCKQLNTLVDTEPFIYAHPDITEEARQRSLECRRRGQPRLLTGLHFYLMGGFDSKNLSKADLTRLIVWAGAKVISREPNPESVPEAERTVAQHADQPGSSLSQTSHIILYQEGNKREPVMKYKMSHMKTLPVAWLTQSIMQHTLLEPDLFVP